MIRLVLPYPPSVNAWKDPSARGGAHAYQTPEVKRYKAAVAALLRRWFGQLPPLTGTVRITADLFRPARIGDTSNRIKILEDCLKGVVIADDSQVAIIGPFRRLDVDPKRPRVQLVVEVVPEPTVFEAFPEDMVRDAVEVGRILSEARRKATQARAAKAQAPTRRELKDMATSASYRRRP